MPNPRLPLPRLPPPPVLTPPLGVVPGEPPVLGVTRDEGVGVGVGVGVGSGVGDGVGDVEPDDGQVWVRLKKSPVPVISAVAPTSVQPAGVTIQAFAVSGPPLLKLPGLAANVIVLVPFAPKSAVNDTKSPLVPCSPGSTKTHTSEPANGPPPWFAEQSLVWNAAAVVETLPVLMLIVLFAAHAGDPIASATAATAPTTASRENGDTFLLLRSKRFPFASEPTFRRLCGPSGGQPDRTTAVRLGQQDFYGLVRPLTTHIWPTVTKPMT